MSKAESKSIDMRKTGGEVDGVVLALISHAYDASEGVRHTILHAINEISVKQPDLVVSGICAFISKRSGDVRSRTHSHLP